MAKNWPAMLYIAAMIAVIVGADLLFFRGRYEARLVANLCIVAAFAAGYFVFFMKR